MHSARPRTSARSRPVQPWRGTAQDDFALDRSRYRYNWDAPIAFDPFDRAQTYFGANVVFATHDRGAHWHVISPDLTRNDKAHQQPSGGPLALDVSSAEQHSTRLTDVLPPSSDLGVIRVVQVVVGYSVAFHDETGLALLQEET